MTKISSRSGFEPMCFTCSLLTESELKDATICLLVESQMSNIKYEMSTFVGAYLQSFFTCSLLTETELKDATTELISIII